MSLSVHYFRLLGGGHHRCQPAHRSHHTRSFHRILLLVLLFLLSFIFVFIFTISVSLLLIGDVHQKVLLDASNTIEIDLDDFGSSEDIAPLMGDTNYLDLPAIQQSQSPGIETWDKFLKKIPKISPDNNHSGKFLNSENLLNLQKFSYHKVGNQSVNECANFPKQASNRLNLVILVHSAADHFSHRQLLRRTWLQLDRSLVEGELEVNVAHVFILGESSSTKIRTKVQLEHRLYSDLVEGNFLDSYHNLTYKHLASLRWAWQFGCAQHADFLFKVDDDAFVDLYAVIDFLRAKKLRNHQKPINNQRQHHHLLACSQFPDSTSPKRTGKWALPYSVYQFETFPSYCSGVGYFITPDLAGALLDSADHLPDHFPVIQIDDVFITGLVRSILSPEVKPVPINSRYVYDVRKLRRWLQNGEGDNKDVVDCPSGYLIGDIGNESDRNELAIALWHKTTNGWRWRQEGRCRKTRAHFKSVKISSL